ncbi:MAG: protein-L-isoaspartate O-methyltransferase [Candidatus Colwellbacteria bacterium]|nr:protein-L-isoaspartate O-methyltransferase [Candidatus Colwellbacteria bacterium]
MTKDELIHELVKTGYLKTPFLIEAFRNIDREDFVPESLTNEAYGNYPLPIGFGQTISQPLTVAFMLELLQPQVGEKILDVGSGSGWQTALLAYVVGDKGKIIAIERIPELRVTAEKNISKYNFVEKGVAEVVLGDGSRGYADGAPYDKIVAAAAGGEIPYEWKKQLKVGGRIVAPVRQSIMVVDKTGTDSFETEEHLGFSFVPLIKD